MRIKEYNWFWKELREPDDIKRLAKKGYDEELLMVLYTEKHVRHIKKSYYNVTARSRKLLKDWKHGHSFDGLARQHQFSPVLMASIVLKEHGMTKKEVREVLNDHKTAKDMRIRHELQEAQEKDLVYSQKGYELQRKRGEDGEARIEQWLKKRGLKYKTEEDLKGSGKTVDFLLDKPLEIEHEGEKHEVCWIESKGSFGDMKKIRRDYTAQLKPYTELWGPGMVVYWFGYLEGIDLWLRARDIIPVEKEWFC